MRYAVSLIYLGYTRNSGAVLFDSDTKEFLDSTPAEVRRLIDLGLVKGLKWRNGDEGPEFIVDTEEFNQQNIPVKSANKFRPYLNDVPGAPINSMYTVVRVLDTDYRGRLYEVVSNKCARIKITEQNLRELSQLTNIAGVWITDNEIKVCDGVQYENRKADAVFSKGTYKDGIAIESLPSTKEILEDKSEPAQEKVEEAPVEQEKTEQTEAKTEAKTEEAPVEQSETEKKEPENLEDIFGSVQEQMEEQVAEKKEQPEESKEQKTEKSTPKSGKRTPKKK